MPVPPKRWTKSSASQIKAFRRCQRAWWWEKIEGLFVPTKPAAKLGIGLHTELEEYILGKRRVGQLDPRLQPGVDFGILSDPLDIKEADVERRFTTSDSALPAGLEIRGVIDLVEAKSNRVTDYKTTSSFRWQRSPEELVGDPQAILYTREGLASYPKQLTLPVTFRHVYFLTKGAPSVRVTDASMTFEVLADGWKGIVATSKEMMRASRLPIAEIPPNLDACADYGGCPFRSNCAATGVASFGPLSSLFSTTKKETTMALTKNFSALLRARRAGQGKTPRGAKTASLTPEKPLSAQAINPPDGTPMDEAVELVPTPPTKPRPAAVDETLQAQLSSREACRSFMEKQLFEGAKKDTLVRVVDRFSEVLEAKIPSSGTKAALIRRLYQSVGLEVPADYAPQSYLPPASEEAPQEPQAAPQRGEQLPEPQEPQAASETPEKPSGDNGLGKAPGVLDRVLYVNCRPRFGTVAFLDEILPPFQAEVAEAAGLPFYNLIEYNNGPKRVAALVAHRIEEGLLELPDAVYADRKSPSTDAVLEVLVAYYPCIIERV